MSREEWRAIPGFSRYEASRRGLIRHIASGGVKAHYLNRQGYYLSTSLTADDGREVGRGVGSLILRTFAGPPPMGKECSHLNGDPYDNRLENLAWETHAENMARQKSHGTIQAGLSHWKAKVSDADVHLIRERLAAGERGSDLAREYGVSRTTISNYKSGRRFVTRTDT